MIGPKPPHVELGSGEPHAAPLAGSGLLAGVPEAGLPRTFPPQVVTAGKAMHANLFGRGGEVALHRVGV